MNKLISDGRLQTLNKYPGSYLACTDPKDVARVESKTYVCTEQMSETMPTPAKGHKGVLGNWAQASSMRKNLNKRFEGCMEGRTMYAIPFCMGPIGSPLSKIGNNYYSNP